MTQEELAKRLLESIRHLRELELPQEAHKHLRDLHLVASVLYNKAQS